METRVALYIYVLCLYNLLQILQLFFINLGPREYGIYYMVYSTRNSLLKNHDKELSFPIRSMKCFKKPFCSTRLMIFHLQQNSCYITWMKNTHASMWIC
jgi:hypothetical protein